jgi:hypothetical protein
MLFKNILNGKTGLNTKAAVKQALRHDIGYQKYVMKQALGEKKYRKNARHNKKPETVR